MEKSKQKSTNPLLGDMNLDEFRHYGHQLIDWISDYLAHPEQYPVLSRSTPGEIKKQLPESPPLEAEGMNKILDDFETIIMPGITHWNHPGFMAYFGITGSGPGILAELLMATLNVNAMLWRTSPAATELEEVTLDWLRQMLGLQVGWMGVIMDTASTSSLVAMATARQAITGLNVRRKGLAGRTDVPILRAYISEHTHSSLEKAAITLGIGQENVVKIATDNQFRLKTDALETAIKADLAKGYCPFFVCATVGTTSTSSIDPVLAISTITQQYKVWLHVDGAYGGVAAILPEKREILAGIEKADSLVVNPHKWLFTPIDLSAFYTRHPHIVKQTFSLLPEYLRNAETDADLVTDYMDYGIQLGRRFRALKLWMVIRTFGQQGLIERLRKHIELAQQFATWVDESNNFERLAPTPLSLVCFRANPPEVQNETALNNLNEQLLKAVNNNGSIFISHTKLNGKYALRLAIGNIRTEEKHIIHSQNILTQSLKSLNF